MRQKKIGNGNKANKKPNKLVKFLAIVFSLVFTFIFVAGIAVLGYMSNLSEGSKNANNNKSTGLGLVGGDNQDGNPEFLDTKKTRTTVLVLGIDGGTGEAERSDAMILVTFDAATNKLDLISIPRDTRVKIPNDRLQILKDLGRWAPSDGYVKINEINSYAGIDYGMEFATKQVEEMLDINIDYCVRFSTKAFRDVVDAMGGVEMTLTRNYYYDDPTQNLYINLKKGTYVLTGKQAEGLVRYRYDYAEGDTKRIRVQQEFLAEMIDQLLKYDSLNKIIRELLVIALDSVTTNITMDEALGYVKYISELDMDNISMYTLPGEGKDIYGGSYYLLYEAEVEELIQEIFYGKSQDLPKDSKEFRIEVLNGAGVGGLASDKREYLEDNGYNVVSVGDYTGAQKSKTVIYVKRAGYGEDLKQLFPGSQITLDKSKIGAGADITIVLGTSEAKSAKDNNE